MAMMENWTCQIKERRAAEAAREATKAKLDAEEAELERRYYAQGPGKSSCLIHNVCHLNGIMI